MKKSLIALAFAAIAVVGTPASAATINTAPATLDITAPIASEASTQTSVETAELRRGRRGFRRGGRGFRRGGFGRFRGGKFRGGKFHRKRRFHHKQRIYNDNFHVKHHDQVKHDDHLKHDHHAHNDFAKVKKFKGKGFKY